MRKDGYYARCTQRRHCLRFSYNPVCRDCCPRHTFSSKCRVYFKNRKQNHRYHRKRGIIRFSKSETLETLPFINKGNPMKRIICFAFPLIFFLFASCRSVNKKNLKGTGGYSLSVIDESLYYMKATIPEYDSTEDSQLQLCRRKFTAINKEEVLCTLQQNYYDR